MNLRIDSGCACVRGGVHLCMQCQRASGAYGALGSQRASEVLELRLKKIVSCPVGAGNRTPSLLEEDPLLFWKWGLSSHFIPRLGQKLRGSSPLMFSARQIFSQHF